MTPQIIVHNVRHPVPDGYTPIYVGRRTSYRAHYEDFSVLGNPFHMRDYDRETAVAMYCEWLEEKLRDMMLNDVKAAMALLAHRVRAGEKLALGCWCSPEKCHAEVIKDVLEGKT